MANKKDIKTIIENRLKIKPSHLFRDGSSIRSGVYTPRYGGQYLNVGEGIKDTRSYINYQSNPFVTLKGNFGKYNNYIGAEVDMLKLIDKLIGK